MVNNTIGSLFNLISGALDHKNGLYYFLFDTLQERSIACLSLKSFQWTKLKPTGPLAYSMPEFQSATTEDACLYIVGRCDDYKFNLSTGRLESLSLQVPTLLKDPQSIVFDRQNDSIASIRADVYIDWCINHDLKKLFAFGAKYLVQADISWRFVWSPFKTVFKDNSLSRYRRCYHVDVSTNVIIC